MMLGRLASLRWRSGGKPFGVQISSSGIEWPQHAQFCGFSRQKRTWRNGRRSGLKIRSPKGGMGSTPIVRTILYFNGLRFHKPVTLKRDGCCYAVFVHILSLHCCPRENLLAEEVAAFLLPWGSA